MDYVALLAHSLYLNIDVTQENEYLEHLIAVSKETILNALDTDQEPPTTIFKHAVILLAGHYYENRLETAEANLTTIPFGIASLIQQMQAEYTPTDGGGQNEKI